MILDTIVASKEKELAAALQAVPLPEMRRRAEAKGPGRGFAAALRGPGMRVIAEVKKASPSKGVIRADFDPVAIARSYSAAGAAAISVLTDGPFFQGDLAYLGLIGAAVPQPLLRKDFTIDAYQVYEARAAGADAVLLIAAVLQSAARLRELRLVAESVGLDALVEVHDADEMAAAATSGATLIGINNRDLKTFHTTLDVTFALAPLAPAGAILVSESGIATAADMRRLREAGVAAILVGESLMRAPDPGEKLKELLSGVG